MAIVFQQLIEQPQYWLTQYDDLPSVWRFLWYDPSIQYLKRFSANKELFDYQIKAIKHIIAMLYNYYNEREWQENLKQRRYNTVIKHYKYCWCKYDIDDLDISQKNSWEWFDILSPYFSHYEKTEGKKTYQAISFEYIINRLSVWFATGSGKSLLIIKTIEIIAILMKEWLIPTKDILFLAPKQTILDQMKEHINEYNTYSATPIKLIEIKSFDETKRHSTLLNFINVFYTKSDLLTEKESENQLDWRNYENQWNWYIILDEAHKWDKQSSKAQQYFAIMSRNGFLFNFSATFTDQRDIFSTVSNFNLAEFIKAWYGKNIYIWQSEYKDFSIKAEEDYTKEQKKQQVLISLLAITVQKKAYQFIKSINNSLYHNPLLVTIGNTVFKEGSDLELFFEQLRLIGKGDVSIEQLNDAKKVIKEDIQSKKSYMYVDENINQDAFFGLLNKLSLNDILKEVYNAEWPWQIEYQTIKWNDQEITFKLKSSNQPFALIKISTIGKWSNDKLIGYEHSPNPFLDNTFINLDKDSSSINVLLGSTSFYEWWDSQRPNVINFVNIWFKDAKKFVVQTIWRGIRINPFGGERQRLHRLIDKLKKTTDIDYENISWYANIIETLFVFATKKDELESVISELQAEDENNNITLLEWLFTKNSNITIPLYYPNYEKVYSNTQITPFPINREQIAEVKSYLDKRWEVVLLYKDNISAQNLFFMNDILFDTKKYFTQWERIDKPVKYIIYDILAHFNEWFEIISESPFNEINDDTIISFKKISTSIIDKSKLLQLEDKIKKVSVFTSQSIEILKSQLQQWEITIDDYTNLITSNKETKGLETFEYNNFSITIQKLSSHYYYPLIIAENDKVDYMQHIINVDSEIKFMQELETNIKKLNADFDDWYFCKLSQHRDKAIYIPREKNWKQAPFIPDFIFWTKKWNDYNIHFIDPKGTEHTDAYRKIDWYKKLYEIDDKIKQFTKNNLNITVRLALYQSWWQSIPKSYQSYWYNSIEDIFSI